MKIIKWYEVTYKYVNSNELYTDLMDSLELNDIITNNSHIEILKANKI